MTIADDKRWVIHRPQSDLQCFLARELNISPTIAGLLVNRGITNAEEARWFFSCKLEETNNPWLLKGIKKAVHRLHTAKEQKEKVTVFGDYDADGITGTVLLMEALSEIGIEASYYIPNRLEDGYDLSYKAIKKIAEEKSTLLLTVDCGVSALDEVKYAQSNYMDVIITDHHQPLESLPEAFSVINPKLECSLSSSYHLAGVGVAFKLAQALWDYSGFCPYMVYERFLDIVTLGTVGDIVPLLGENRIFVKHGLKHIAETKREGLKNLIEVAGLSSKEMSTLGIAYGLAPRLNAAGRIGSASSGVELLTTSSSQKGYELAGFLNKENQKRQLLEENIFKEAQEQIERLDLNKEKIIVVYSDIWHYGIIGIVASKLTEKYNRPVVIITFDTGNNNEGRGSARSISEFNIYEALKHVSGYLLQYGGHERAAGLRILKENIEGFKKDLNKFAEMQMSEEMLVPTMNVEGEVFFAELNEAFLNQLEEMAPFGEGNPKPLLAYRGAKIDKFRAVGKNNDHLKACIIAEGIIRNGIGFELYSKLPDIYNREIDLVFYLEENIWQEEKQIQLNIKDLKASTPKNILLKSNNFVSQKNHFDNIFEGNNYFISGISSSVWQNIVNFLIEKHCQNKRILVVGATPAISGSFFSGFSNAFLEAGLSCWLLRPSCSEEKMLQIEEEFQERNGIVCTDITAYKEIKNRFSFNDLIIFLGFLESEEVEEVCKFQGNCSYHEKPVIINSFRNFEEIVRKYGFWELNSGEIETPTYKIYEESLEKVLSNNNKTVIYCATEKEVLEVYKLIRNNSDEKAVFCHPRISTSKKELAIEMFRQGLVKFFITTSMVSLEILEKYDQVFFNTLPFDKRQYLFLFGGINNKLNIMMAKDAVSNTKNVAKAVFPTQEVLFQIYTYLNTYNIFKIKDCVNLLKSNGFARANEETIRVAIAIFKELGLFKAPNKDFVLDYSWRYKIIQKQQKELHSFLDLLSK